MATALSIGFVLSDEETEMLVELCDKFSKTPHEAIVEIIHVLYATYIEEEDE